MKKRIEPFGIVVVVVTCLGMFFALSADPQDVPPEKPTPARDRFVEVFAAAPLAFNASFVRALDADTTATAAQRYAALKALVLLEESAGARNIGSIFADAPPALKARLKTVTAAAIREAKIQAQQAEAEFDTKIDEALSAE